jgi:hypothetical protein
MKKHLAVLPLLLALTSSWGQAFSGSIEFRRATQKDTAYHAYHVKDQMVKLDQYSPKKDKTVEGSFLFDLNAGEIKFLNPKRKLWGRRQNETPQVINGTCIVSQGKATKTIAGVKCKQYIVKNADENTVITYWIAEDKYDFFLPVVKLWNGKDKQSIYFGQIKNLKPGSMPLLSEEKQLDTGKILSSMEVIKITKAQLPDNTFMVPKDYSPLQ